MASASGMGRATFLVIALLAPFGCAPSPPERPNLVLVVLDTMRRDVASFPDGRYTPRLERLAASGTRFSAAWSTSPWTVPSHASMFTGRLPSGHGCTSRNVRFEPPSPPLAEILRDEGYETAAFYANPWLTDEMTGLLRGFETRVASPFDDPDAPDADQGGAATLRHVDEWLAARRGDRPFFLFVNLLEAHLPYNPPTSYREARLPDLAPDRLVTTGLANRWNAGLLDPDDVPWEYVRALYAGDAASADAFLGGLVDRLEARGGADGAVIVVTSDHGENLGDHGRMDHQFGVWGTLLAVPLVIVAPGRTAPDVRDDGVMLTDLFATFLAAAGVRTAEIPPTSRSLLEAPAPGPRPLFAEYAGPPPTHVDLLRRLDPDLDEAPLLRSFVTVRVGPLRLTRASDGGETLHDVAADPGQTTDLAAREPGVLRELGASIAGLGLWKSAPGAPIDEATRRRLRALGYAD